jgi:hypothetical protein
VSVWMLGTRDEDKEVVRRSGAREVADADADADAESRNCIMNVRLWIARRRIEEGRRSVREYSIYTDLSI